MQGGLFVPISRSSYSKRWVSRRVSTASTGERPENGFPSVAVRDVRGVESTDLGGFMASLRSLREAVKAFLYRVTRFLRVTRFFRGGVFGCGEARSLVEWLWKE